MGTREENVRLTVSGDFDSKMAKAAASAALLEHSLNDLSGTTVRHSQSTNTVTRDTDAMARSMDKGRSSIDQYSGRLSLLASAAGAIGPSIIPIAALAVPAVSGLAAQFGFAGLAAGTAIGAFQGVGNALTAMNKASLQPTETNLKAAQLAMEEISPAAQDMVRQLRDMGPALKALRDTGASDMFPGMVSGMQSLETLLPTVQRIVGAVAGELGSIAADSGASLASGRWADFFTFLRTDAPAALRDMATAAGNTGHAMAELWMATDPLNDDFSHWMVDATASLDKWASGLAKTDGFAEFIAYIQTTGPQVGATLGAIASALVQIVEAAAPIAGPILQGIEGFAKAIGAVADSDLGTPIFGMIAALSALNLAMRATGALSKMTFGNSMLGNLRSQVAGYKGLAAAQREVAAATTALSMADLSRSAAAVRARNAQSALLPQAEKRGSVSQFVAASKAQETAALRVAEAERVRSRAVMETAKSAGKAGAVVGGLALATSGLGDNLGVSNTIMLAMMGSVIPGWGTAVGAAAGAALDLAHANDDLRDATAGANAAINAGDIDAMAAKYKELGKSIKETNDVSFWDPHDVGAGFKKIASFLDGTTGKAKDAQHEITAAMGQNSLFSMGEQMIQASTASARGFTVTGAAAHEAAMSVKELSAAMEKANAAMNAISSEDALRTATLDARALAKESGKVLSASGKILLAHQREGIAARAALVGMGSAAQAAGEKMKTGFAKTKFLDDKRRDFIRIAQAMGMSKRAAQQMANDFGLIDRLHATPKVTVKGALEAASHVKGVRGQIDLLKGKIVEAKAQGAKESSPLVRALRAEIDRLKGKQVPVGVKGAAAAIAAAHAINAAIAAINPFKQITIQTRHTTIRGPQARGNLWLPDVQHYAYGDIANRHMPELAGPGPTRVWREPETQGEAYIPLANDDRRPRARAIAAETVSLLGGVAHFADGDVVMGARRRHNNNGGNNNDHPHRHNGNDNHKHVNRFVVALKEATKSLDKEKAARDALISKRNDLSGTVRDKFLSDPFAGGNVWAAGGGNPLGILKADISKANAFKSVLFALKKSGLHGDALASIASTGDMGQAQALLSMGKGGIGQYEKLFDQRAKAAGAVGNYAGNAAYGAAIATTAHQVTLLNAHVVRLEHTIRRQHKEAQKNHKHNADHTGKAVAKGVNKAASAGTRGSRGHR